MRRIAILVGSSALLLVMVVGVAVAVTRVCDDKPCEGTNDDDQLFERIGNREDDRILGLDGKDVIDAGTYTRDRDVLEGGRKDDRLLTDDGDGKDTARGDRGNDRCVADSGDTVSSCKRISPTSAEGVALSSQGSNEGASADDSE